jgi:hypothetical protein
MLPAWPPGRGSAGRAVAPYLQGPVDRPDHCRMLGIDLTVFVGGKPRLGIGPAPQWVPAPGRDPPQPSLPP